MMIHPSKKFYNKFGNVVTTCPICKKTGPRTHISRHLMNAQDESHRNYRILQNEKILSIYDGMNAKEFSVYDIASCPGILCSPSHVGRIIKKHRKDYADKCRSKRGADVSAQYQDGRRSKRSFFAFGWKPSRERGDGPYMGYDKYSAIMSLFMSSLTAKAVAEKIGCKSETVIKLWREKHGRERTSARNRRHRVDSITKVSVEMERDVKEMFHDPKITIGDMANKWDVSDTTIRNIMRKHFSKRKRMLRAQKVFPEAIRRSLSATGKAGITGSVPEQRCFELLLDLFDEDVVHHDYSAAPPYEVDITIPSRKIAICWDGPFHRKPIFGQAALDKVQKRDSNKCRMLLNAGWRVFVVEDDCNSHTQDDSKIKRVVLAIASSADVPDGTLVKIGVR